MQTHREPLSYVKVEGGSKCRLQPRWLSAGHIPLTKKSIDESMSRNDGPPHVFRIWARSPTHLFCGEAFPRPLPGATVSPVDKELNAPLVVL